MLACTVSRDFLLLLRFSSSVIIACLTSQFWLCMPASTDTMNKYRGLIEMETETRSLRPVTQKYKIYMLPSYCVQKFQQMCRQLKPSIEHCLVISLDSLVVTLLDVCGPRVLFLTTLMETSYSCPGPRPDWRNWFWEDGRVLRIFPFSSFCK